MLLCSCSDGIFAVLIVFTVVTEVIFFAHVTLLTYAVFPPASTSLPSALYSIIRSVVTVALLYGLCYGALKVRLLTACCAVCSASSDTLTVKFADLP